MDNQKCVEKQNIAKVINSAINDIIENGSSDEKIFSWKENIKNTLNENIMTSNNASMIIEGYHKNLFDKIMLFRGFPVKNIGGSSNDISSLENFSDFEFGEIMPILSNAFSRSINFAKTAAEPFRNAEISQAITSFEKWANAVPAEGVKEKSHRLRAAIARNDVKATSSWHKRFLIVHRTDFMSEASHIFACKKGAIAGEWEWSKYPGCESHKDMDGKIFFFRYSAAYASGLLDPSVCKFFDDIIVPGSNGCLCRYSYIFNIFDVPDIFLSKDVKNLNSQKNINTTLRSYKNKPVSWWRRIFPK